MESKIVYKYTIAHSGELLELPPLSKFLHFADQFGQLTVWYELPHQYKEGVLVRHKLQIIGTGQPIPLNFKHLATCQQGPFIWHLYEEVS